MNKLTQINLYDTSQGNLKGFGALGLEQGQDAPLTFTMFITSTIGLLSIIAIIWFIFILLTGAISLITSGGDKATAENARKRIGNGLVGLLLTFFGIFIVVFVGQLFGIDGILNLTYLLNLLQIK